MAGSSKGLPVTKGKYRTNRMLGKDFAAWIEHMKLSDSEAARRLGISRTSLIKYREEGAPVYIGLACAALAFGLPPWRQVGAD